jgi:hypothetical protein
MSQINESLNATGVVTAVLRDANNNIKMEQVTRNMVVTAGLNFIAGRLNNSAPPTPMSHMAIGSSSTAAALTDTTLGTEIGSGGRVSLATTGGVISGKTITFSASFGTSIVADVKEAGVFNAGTAGTMLCRTVFPTIPMLSGDTLTISWTVTIG